MTNAEFNQHEDEADSLNEPCDGNRRVMEEMQRVQDEVFSSAAIERRLTNWNKDYCANHGLLDPK